MSDEIKEKTFEIPMVPFFGLDLARDLGSLEAQQRQMGTDILEIKRDIKALDARLNDRIDALDARLNDRIDALDARLNDKIDAIDAKFEAKTDKMGHALHRLDERTRHLSMVTWGGIIVLLIAIIAQRLL